MPTRLKILETCLYVSDLAVAKQFYVQVLGLEFYSAQPDRHVFLRCAGQMLLLFNPTATLDPASSLPLHGAHGPGHVAFAVAESEIDGWREWLTARDVEIEKEVAWPAGGRSLYFRDPAGNSVEIASPRLWGLPDPVRTTHEE